MYWVTGSGLEPDLCENGFFKNPKLVVLKCEELGPKLGPGEVLSKFQINS